MGIISMSYQFGISSLEFRASNPSCHAMTCMSQSLDTDKLEGSALREVLPGDAKTRWQNQQQGLTNIWDEGMFDGSMYPIISWIMPICVCVCMHLLLFDLFVSRKEEFWQAYNSQSHIIDMDGQLALLECPTLSVCMCCHESSCNLKGNMVSFFLFLSLVNSCTCWHWIWKCCQSSLRTIPFG